MSDSELLLLFFISITNFNVTLLLDCWPVSLVAFIPAAASLVGMYAA